jgi:hypothetical protein
MPTLSKPQLIERESPWRRESDRIQRELCRKGVPILAGLGYYAERDLPVPEADQLMLVQDVEALKPITGALTFAAAASEELSDAGVIATLRKVSRNPSLLRLGQLPPEVEWDIACNYQRGDEKPGTHWPDVWGDQPAIFGGLVEVPTDANIGRAAFAAIAKRQGAENAGGVPMPQIKCSRSIWAKFTDKVANGSPVIVIPKCATGSWSLLSRDLFTIFSASYFRHCKRTFGNGDLRP